MPSEAIEISVVVACYEEEGHLEESVREIVDVLDCLRWSYEVIFVEDCSHDRTRAVVARLVEQYADRNFSAIYHEQNMGRGRTVADGIRAARGNIVGFLDIDLEVHARYIPAFVQAIRSGNDVAIGHRVYKLNWKLFYRHILSRGYVALVKWMLGIHLDDTEAGYKFFNRERILPVLDETEDPGWFWDTEIVVRALWRGYRIAEIPCLFIRRSEKKSTVRPVRDSLEYIKRLWHFRAVARRLRHDAGPR